MLNLKTAFLFQAESLEDNIAKPVATIKAAPQQSRLLWTF